MIFSKNPTKETLQGRKAVTVCGSKFVIRRINPLLDFPMERMPQVFTSFVSKRKQAETLPQDQKKILEEMRLVVEAGLVDPELVPRGKEGITVEDIFRDTDCGVRLYWEILWHSMYRLKGLKGVFFSIGKRLLLSTLLRGVTDRGQATSFLTEEKPQ